MFNEKDGFMKENNSKKKKILSIGLNKRGLLFTIMTLFLIFGIITLNEVLADSFRAYSPPSEALSLYSAASIFRNASSIILDLDKTGYAKTSIEHIYPFKYSLDKDLNSFLLSQEYSLDSEQLGIIFDYLNLSEILLSDENYSHAFSGIVLDINSPKNSAWGGTTSAASFLLLPFCYQYTLFDSSTAGFSKTTNNFCTEDFDYSKIRRIDINIHVLTSSADFSSLLCDNNACPTDSFNPLNPNPFYNISVLDENCLSCALTQKTASSHFLPSSSLFFALSGSASPTLSINLSKMDLNYSYSSEQKLNISTSFLFNKEPTGFIVKGVNIAAHLPTMKAEKKSD